MCFFLDEKDVKEHEIILAFKINKFLLKEETSAKIYQLIKNKIALDNVFSIHSLAKLHQIATVSDLSLGYIERCFPMVVETQNFLHLDFSIVAKIFTSSELNIHSEVEIFIAAINWLKHNSNERNKYAKQLLTKVRFPLLSKHALNNILDKDLSFYNNDKFLYLLKEIISKKETSSLKTKNRYCSQNNFKLLICGGYNTKTRKTVSNIDQVDGCNFNNVKVLPSMENERQISQAVCLKGEAYLFGGSDCYGNYIMSVEKYSPANNIWKKVTHIFDDRGSFCACAFMNKVFVFGGYYP